jgi:hypothetical protein
LLPRRDQADGVRDVVHLVDFIIRSAPKCISPNPAYFGATPQFLIDGFTSITLLDGDVEACLLLALQTVDDGRPAATALTGYQYSLVSLRPLLPGDDAPAVICRTAVVGVSYTARATLPLLQTV